MDITGVELLVAAKLEAEMRRDRAEYKTRSLEQDNHGLSEVIAVMQFEAVKAAARVTDIEERLGRQRQLDAIVIKKLQRRIDNWSANLIKTERLSPDAVLREAGERARRLRQHRPEISVISRTQSTERITQVLNALGYTDIEAVGEPSLLPVAVEPAAPIAKPSFLRRLWAFLGQGE